MFLQLTRFGFSHNHPRRRSCRHMSEADLAYLQTFRSLVLSEDLKPVSESLKLGSELLSLTWIHKCFQMLPMIHNAFAKLMMEIDYPVSSWESGSIEEYLDYTINLLELLNMISSSLSHVNQARVSLMHGLSLMKSSRATCIERMREIKKHDCIKELKVCIDGGNDHIGINGKEWIFHEAIMVMRSTGFWVCGVVLSGLKSDVGPIMEIMSRVGVVNSSLMDLDSKFKKKFMEEGGVVKEVEGVNESVRLIGMTDSYDGMELKRRLEVVGNGLKILKEEEEGLFGSVMAARNQLIETLRRNNKW